MGTPASDEVTRLLRAAADGDRAAVDRLVGVLYDELRRVASSHLARERAGHTLSATALVHEAYAKLVGQASVGFRDRSQFFAAAATVMRRILIDHARTKGRVKRGGGVAVTALDEALVAFEERAQDLVMLDDALIRLAAEDPRKARLVELRFFGGLGVSDAAETLGISVRTAEREWTVARAWLRRAMGGETA